MIFRDDNTETSKDSKEEEPTKITPFHVENKNKKAINYDHVIELFGCLKIHHSLFEEFSRITGKKLHRFMRRELCYAHRDFNVLLKHVEEGKKIYLYTGRGPSSKSLHLGHCLPFILCVYFQKIFKCHVVIQITDDEKYLYKDYIKSREQIKEYAIENIKDIIAFGFDPKLTFIFMNSESMPILIENYLRICKVTKVSEILPVFGFDDKSTNIGMISFPALQMAPAYASTFDFLDKDALCLIPCAIDQDPYFRLVRDKAVILKEKKPTSLYVKLLPDLCGHHKKMSSSTDSTPIFLNDTKEMIAKKIMNNAFSGGQATLKDHRKYGGNPEVDMSFHYLRYFLEDDNELAAIKESYSKGIMTSIELKKKCIDTITEFVENFKKERSKIDEKIYKIFTKKK